MSKTQLEECPYCGSNRGYFTKMQASGTVICHVGFDGSERENTDMYNALTLRGGKVAYCSSCEKSLFKLY